MSASCSRRAIIFQGKSDVLGPHAVVVLFNRGALNESLDCRTAKTGLLRQRHLPLTLGRLELRCRGQCHKIRVSCPFRASTPAPGLFTSGISRRSFHPEFLPPDVVAHIHQGIRQNELNEADSGGNRRPSRPDCIRSCPSPGRPSCHTRGKS